MKAEIEKIMKNHAEHFATGKDYRAKNFPKWGESVAQLNKMKLEMKNERLAIKNGIGGGSANIVPWLSLRATGSAGSKLEGQQGIYLTYLFSQDGKRCYLTIMQATTVVAHYPEKRVQKLETIKNYSKQIRELAPADLDVLDFAKSTLNQTEIDLNSSRQKEEEWESACSFSICYDVNKIPSDEVLKKDLGEMLKLFDTLAENNIESSTNKSLNELLDEIKSNDNVTFVDSNKSIKHVDDGWTLSEEKIKQMLRAFAILPYGLIIEEEPLEFEAEEWKNLVSICPFLSDKSGSVEWHTIVNRKNDLKELMRIVMCYNNVIIEGPPGVGKTYFFKELKKKFKPEYTTFLTFHPSTQYGDFIGGLKPAITEAKKKKTLDFESSKGHFLRALEQTKSGPTLLWIDEINRGNVSKIFGELIGLIGTNDPQSPTIRNVGLTDGLLDITSINLDNLYIVGTINTADRSISHLDSAIRRRFRFVRMHPDIEILPPSLRDEIKAFKEINSILNEAFGSDALLGHSYLFEMKDNPKVNKKLIWKYSILPNIADILMSESHDDIDKIIKSINKAIPCELYLRKMGTGYSMIVQIDENEIGQQQSSKEDN